MTRPVNAPTKYKRARGGTGTHKFLKLARSMLSGGKSRRGAKKIVLLMTDGKPDKPSEAKKEANKLKGDGVTIYGVLVGTDNNKMKDVLSSPFDKHLMSVSNFNQMAPSVAKVTSMTCPPEDCKVDWKDWSQCNPGTGKKTRTYKVIRKAKNGGAACPAEKETKCPVACEVEWKDWSKCNPGTGTKNTNVQGDKKGKEEWWGCLPC